MNRHPKSNLIWDTLRNPKCEACDLHKEAKTICLLGDGPVPAKGLVLGEAPGYREDSVEIPFSGKSGLFLRKMLKEIGLDPRELYITNVAACRPPGNRPPTRKEAKTCSELYLVPQIERVAPRAALLLGNTAVSFALGKKASVTKMEGTTFNYEGIICVPSRHPSSVIRAEGEEGYAFVLQQFRENLLLFKRVLNPQKEDEFKFSSELPDKLEEGKAVYTDIETTGLSPFVEDAKIHSAGFAQYPASISCFALNGKRHVNVNYVLKNFPIIAHRTTFEGTWYRQHFGITPRIYHDTKLMAYLIDENEPSGLKYQAIRYLGVEPWAEEMDFKDPDLKKLLPYNARDVQYGLRLYRERDLPFLKKNPKIARLMRYILLPAIEVFIEIICNGFHIDEKAATKKLKHCQDEKKKLNDKLNEIAGKEVNPGSPKQMSHLFYKQLALTCPVKTKKGADSTSEASLVRLKGQHEAVDVLWAWRGWEKYDSTYLTPWLEKGPILHANYDFTGTDTGRLSSSMVKNSRNEKGTGAVIHQCPRDAFIRNLIVARNKGWYILAADLSQIELRWVAHHANEETMIQIFRRGEDIHLATAQTLRKGEIDKETRKRAKAVNFGFVYGMYAPKFQAYAKEKFEIDLTLKEAKDYRRKFFEKYNGLLSWHRRVEAFVRQNGYIDSVFGRRRHLPEARDASEEDCPDCLKDIKSDCFLCGGTGIVSGSGSADEWIRRENVRQAINSPIQSAANELDLLIAALIASYSLPWDFKIDRKRTLPIGAAHDSLLFEVEPSYAKTLKEGILWTVKNLPLKKFFDIVMRVPILIDVNVYSDCWEGKVVEL